MTKKLKSKKTFIANSGEFLDDATKKQILRYILMNFSSNNSDIILDNKDSTSINLDNIDKEEIIDYLYQIVKKRLESLDTPANNE